MKLLTNIIFLLITSTYAARLSIDVFPSSHLLQADGTVPGAGTPAKGCLIPHLGRCGTCSDTSIKKQLKCLSPKKWTFKDCDCPTGSSCKEHDPFLDELQPTCRVDGREVHMGATEYDFEALNMVLQDTQIRPTATETTNDLLAAFSSVVNDRSGNGEGQSDKYPRYSVRIEGIDGRAYKSCSVTPIGTVADAITIPLDLATADVADSNAPKMEKNAKKQSVECLFRPYNEAFLGMVSYNISFVRDPAFLSPLEDELQSVEMQIKFVPNAVDDAKWHLAARVSDSIPYLFPDFDKASRDSADENKDQAGTLSTDESVFRFHSYATTPGTQGPGFDISSDSALKGTLKLPVKGKFFDKRYLIVDESGTDVLIGGVGEGEMRKEGMEIHKDFDGFYDPTRDAFDNLGLKMQAVAFGDRIANTDLNTALKDAAQFQMEHTYAMTYGGDYEGELAHFQPDYLACDICDAQIVFKAFPATGIHTGTSPSSTDFLLKYHVTVEPDKLPTSSNVISLNQIDVDVVEEASGHRTFDESYGSVSVSRKMALRLPSDKDPQNPDGYPLYQFLRPKISTSKKDYTSLLDAYNFSMSVLDFEGNTAGGDCKQWDGSAGTGGDKDACIKNGNNWVATKGLQKSSGCQNGKLYEIGTNIFSAAEKVFKENCRIKLEDHTFGENMNITFGEGASKKTAYLRQNDLRSVYAGATELSILRRKLDPSAVLLGNKVSFKVSKYGHTGKIEFLIKGTETMVGYANDGTECTQPMVASSDAAVNKGCAGLATLAETNLTITSNAKSVEHSVRSSSSCFRYFDIELHDVANPWAIYQLRLPCNRITSTETEALNLTYSFSSAYDLFDDRFTGKIGYEIPTGMGLSITEDKTSKLQYGFGSCLKQNGIDAISRPSTCADDSDTTSGAEAKTITGWGDGSAITANGAGSLEIVDTDKVTLEALRDCDQLATDAEYIDDSGEQYILKHSLALIYTRSDPDSAGRTDIKYCQDQQFITTIRRDATAAVTVGTLVDKSLERSVMVTAINWVQCSKDRVECKQSDDCYKLRIELDAKDQDKSAGTWANTKLTNVEIGSGAINTDSLTLDITGVNETGGSSGYLNDFALESACGVVDDCDKGTGSHYDSLIEQETHFVISGFFENLISTSNVEVETKFEACPIQNNTQMDGDVLRLGMQISCVSATNKDASDVQTTGGDLKNDTTTSMRDTYLDCTQAEATAYARIATEVAISKEADKDSNPIAAGDFTTAATNGWEIQNITYTINRYEALLDGSKDVTRKVSSTAVLRYGRGVDAATDELFECEKLASRIPGLSLFDEKVMDCDDDFTTKSDKQAISGSAINHASVLKIYFDLIPLLDANLDVFEVEADAILINKKIDDTLNPSRRRLRSVKHTYQLPRLNADDEIVGTTSGFRVLTPSKEISDEVLPSAPADAPVSESGKADSTSSGEADVDTWLILVIVLCVVAIAGVLVLVNKDKMCPASGGSAAPASAEEGASLLVGNKKTRFSNLRY